MKIFTADELLSGAARGNKVALAEDLIREQLAGGQPVLANEIYQLAKTQASPGAPWRWPSAICLT